MGDVDKLLPLCASEDISKRVEAYRSLTEKLSQSNLTEWGHSTTSELAKLIVTNLRTDLLSDEENVSYEVTGFLGCYLANEKLMDLLTDVEEQLILESLLKVLEETKEKTVLTRGLWSLAQSKFECEIYSKNLSRLLNLIIEILKCDPSAIIIYEALQVMKSLMESVPKEIIDKVEDWLPLVFVHLFHDTLKIRGVAYSCINFCLLFNQQKNATSPLNKYLVSFIPQLKSHYCKQMIKFVEENCIYVLKIWRLLVIILSKDLHSGTSLINGFLEVVEKAFKSSKPELRVNAFKCWHVLIGNFASDIEVLAHPKRLKLLIAPLKSNNAKTEDIAFIKLHTWWFFVCKMESKILINFDLIIVPLLKFCFNPNRVSQSKINERTLLMSGNHPPCIKYPNLIIKSCEVLAIILSYEQKSKSEYTYSLLSLSHPVINTSVFMKNSSLILGCLADILMSLNSSEKNHLELGLIILEATLKYVNLVVKANPDKKESIEVVKELFTIYDFLEEHSKPNDSLSLFAYKLMHMISIGDVAFPRNVLHSRQYHISTGSKMKDIMHGTLSNYFVHKLCRPVLLHFAPTDSGFLELWSSVLTKSKPSNKLMFLEMVMEELEHASQSLCPENPDTLISLWNVAAKVLDAYIEETQQINQGDNSEHDWTCIYNTLLFPLNCSEDTLSRISSSVYEDLLVNWTNLWQHFSSLTPLATTAEPNSESEFLMKKILEIVHSGDKASADSSSFRLSFFASVLYVIVHKFRFKELGKKPKKLLQSPLKPKKKPHPLFALASVVDLLNLLMDKTLQMTSHWRQKSMQKLCHSFVKVFTNISQDRMVWVAVSSVIEVLRKALQINPSAKFTADVETVFVSMWNAFCGLVECRVVPRLTRDQLSTLSPLISVALQSSHLGLRQRTRLMWSTSFASTSHPIPTDLFQVLKSVGLPPASISETPVGESQSLSPKENIPTHISGSFLNREKNQEFSPFSSVKLNLNEKETLMMGGKSPLPSKSPKGRTPAKSKISIDELKADEFVMVSSPKLSKRVLTPHQVEKMKQRASDIPALYNDMSQSISQLPPQFMSQDSFEPSQEENASLSFKGKIGKGKCLDFETCVSPEKDLNRSGDSSSSSSSSEEATKNRSYSDEELNNVLRDVSVEMERSFSDSVVVLNGDREEEEEEDEESSSVRKSKRAKCLLTYTKNGIIVNQKKGESPQKTSSHALKRKSMTPSRKSLSDIRRSLKGTPNKAKAGISSSSQSRKVVEDSKGHSGPKPSSQSKSASRSKSPSPSPSKTKVPKQESLSKRGKASPVKDKETADSEDEIPNSQADTSAASTLLLFPFNSPKVPTKASDRALDTASPGKERPKRNKRKSIFEDDSIYVTPTKRSKTFLSPRKEKKADAALDDSVVILDGNANDVIPVVVPECPLKAESAPEEEEESGSNSAPAKGRTEKLETQNLDDESDPKSEETEKQESNSEAKKAVKGKREESVKKNSKDQSKVVLPASVLLSPPSKITRSGRRFVAPNKDMPEPMTSPVTGLRKEDRHSPKGSSRQDDAPKTTRKSPVGPRKSSSSKESIVLREKRKTSSEEHSTEEGEGECPSELDSSITEEASEEEGIRGKKGRKTPSRPLPRPSARKSLRSQSKKEEEEEEQEKDPKENDLLPTDEDERTEDLSSDKGKEDSLRENGGHEKASPLKEKVSSAVLSSPNKTKGNDLHVIHVNSPSKKENCGDKHAGKSLLKDLNHASVIIRTVANSSSTSTVSPSSSAIFVSRNQKESKESSHVESSNCNKYKVIFSSPGNKSSPNPKDKLPPAKDSLANGGIVLTKSPTNPCPNFNSKPALTMSKSINKFSPIKSSTAMLTQIHFKKVGNMSPLRDKHEEGSALFQVSSPHSRDNSPWKSLVTKVCIKDLEYSKHSSKQTETDGIESMEERSHSNLASPLRFVSSPKGLILSPLRSNGSSPKLSMSMMSDGEFSDTAPKKLSDSLTSESFLENFQMIRDKSIPSHEGSKVDTTSPSKSSPPKSVLSSSSASPKVLSWSSKPMESTALPSTLSSPTQTNKKIFFISSPKNSSSPQVQKIIYSPSLKSSCSVSPIKVDASCQVKSSSGKEEEEEEEKKETVSSVEPTKDESSKTKAIQEEDKPVSNEQKEITSVNSEKEAVVEEKNIAPSSKESPEEEEEESKEKEAAAPNANESDVEEEPSVDQKQRKRKRMLRKFCKPVRTDQRALKRKNSNKKTEPDTMDIRDLKLDKDIEDILHEKDIKITERDSPDKDDSKLSNSVSTPERKNFSVMKVQIPGSRAAIMLACAKRTMRTRVDDSCDSPSGVKEGGALHSPGITPGRKRPLSEVYLDGKPWAKHEPSPGASPCGSILKKRPAEEEVVSAGVFAESSELDGSPSTLKNRRVSFADPPVSESVEIPPSPKVLKGHKAQKRLDMTQAIGSAKSFMSENSQSSQESEDMTAETPSCSQPLYSPLLTNVDSVDLLAPLLTSPFLVDSLKIVFEERGIRTVGEFCALSEMELLSFPVRAPKAANALKALKKYQEMAEANKVEAEASENASLQEEPPAGVEEGGPDHEQPSKKRKLNPEQDILIEFGPDVDPAKEARLGGIVEEKEEEEEEKEEKKQEEEKQEEKAQEKKKEEEEQEKKKEEEEQEEKKKEEEEQEKKKEEEKEEKEAEPTNEEHRGRIEESEFPKSFCDQIERDSTAASSFVQGLSADTRLKLLETLTGVLPYQNVIDMFHKYLTKQNAS